MAIALHLKGFLSISLICFEYPCLTGITNNGNTRVCRSFTLVVTKTSLSFHMLCSLPKELNALAINSCVDVSIAWVVLCTQEPKYVNSVTCSRLFPYSLMLRASCSLLMQMVCVFQSTYLHVICNASELTESNRCCRSSADPASNAISSANCRFLNK